MMSLALFERHTHTYCVRQSLMAMKATCEWIKIAAHELDLKQHTFGFLENCDFGCYAAIVQYLKLYCENKWFSII